MQDNKKLHPNLYLLFTLLALAVLNGILVLIRAELQSTTGILVLYYACSLLSLFGTMIGLGASLFYLSRGLSGDACRVLLMTEGISLIPLLTASVRTAFDYPDYFADALALS